VIGKLTGKIDSLSENSLIVDVGGVGYLVHCSARTLRALPGVGAPVALAIETAVREDAITLYGFLDPAERDWFRLLQTVQGVGAKVALSIFAALSTGEIARAIATQDKASLGRAQGVGPKLAQRIASELKDKVGALPVPAGASLPGAALAPVESGPVSEAVSALINLGYRRIEATDAVAKVQGRLGEGANTADLIRAALKELGR
jgi:Holliday junction DNA helicase RuvA